MTGHAAQSPRLAGGNAPSPLATIAFIIIVAIALLRCVIVFAPQTVFDVDPAASPVPWGGLGMAGSLTLDVMMMFGCALGLFGEWRSGRGINLWLTTLVLIPAPIIMWHGSREAGHLWLGSTWLAAMIGSVTLVHLARDAMWRRTLIALLLAIGAPLLLRGLSQITWEHAATVSAYQESKAAFLHAQGWDADSPAVKIYERRLMQPQPLGWFATTNILATMLAGILVGSTALAVSSWRTKLPSGWTGVAALIALGCGAMLAFTGSKGAFLAVAAGAFMLIMLCVPRLAGVFASRPGAFSLVLIAITIIAVILRGALLPESFLGDKSLLFRWHYWLASVGIIINNFLTGVGPDGFQAAYTMFRVPRNPEEVASAHNIFIDGIATLGVNGLAWVLLVILLTLTPRLRVRKDEPKLHAPPITPSFAPIIVISLLVMLGSLFVEWPVIDSDFGFDFQSAMVRVLGFGLMPVIAIVLFKIMGSVSDREKSIAIMAALTTVLVHAQIEMSLTQPGPPAWAFAWLALVGAAGHEIQRHRRITALFTAIVVAIIAAWITVFGVVPATAQQQIMERAAVPIRVLSQNLDDERLVLERRRAAADELVLAYDRWPINVRPLEAAVIQLELASARVDASAPIGLVMQAADLIDRAIAEHGRPSSISLGVVVHSRLARVTGDAEHWARAIELATRLTQLDPNGLGAWRRLGDVLWMAGQKPQAAEAYRRALECDANFALDKLKQLSEKDRKEIERRISEIGEAWSPAG